MKIREHFQSYNVGSTMLVALLLLWISQLKECAREQNQVLSMLQLYYMDVFPGRPHTSASLLFVLPPFFNLPIIQTALVHRQLSAKEAEWKADEGSSRSDIIIRRKSVQLFSGLPMLCCSPQQKKHVEGPRELDPLTCPKFSSSMQNMRSSSVGSFSKIHFREL